MSAIHVANVSFSYSSAVPIIHDATFDLGPGWTGLVGANGAGKSTLLSLMAGVLEPDTGAVTVEPSGLPPILCEQRVDDLTPAIDDLARAWDRTAVRTRAALELDPGHIDRWPTLSPGERKRWQVGAALVARPDVLLLDEPTNHLDTGARDILLGALAAFGGCGVVVSHDRALLDELTTRTLRIAGGTTELWNGPYAAAHDAWTARASHVTERRRKLRAEETRVRRRLADQRRRAEQKDAERERVRRTAGIHDLDARGAVATGRHASGQAAGSKERSVTRAKQAALSEELDATRTGKELGGSIGFDFEPAPKEYLVRFEGVVLAGNQRLFDANVAVRRTDRIRVAGPNGIGKTSLVDAMVTGVTIPPDRMLHLRQETSAADGRVWLDEARSLDPRTRGRVMALVALLGSDPGAILASDLPSPGEARKLALALGLGTAKWLLILDEPTNHLDLPSIERLQGALEEYPGAVVLITHDGRLAEAVTDETWTVDESGVAQA